MFGNVRTNNSLSSIRFSVSVHVVNSTKTWTSHPMHCTCTDNPLRVNKGRFWNTKWESEMREKKFVLTLFERWTLCSVPKFISVRKTGWFAMNEDWKWNNSQSQWVNCFSIHGWCVWCIIFYGQQNSMAMNYLTIYTLCTVHKFAWKAWNKIYTQKNPTTNAYMRQTEEILSSFICRQNPHRQTHVVLTLISDSSVV